LTILSTETGKERSDVPVSDLATAISGGRAQMLTRTGNAGSRGPLARDACAGPAADAGERAQREGTVAR
jgi:hypothetical protein